MNEVVIRRGTGLGKITAWIDGEDLYIRESLDRGRDVQTVCLSAKELETIVKKLQPELQNRNLTLENK